VSEQAVKRTPIFELAQRQGASFAEVDGWLVVERFGDDRPVTPGESAPLALVDCSARAKVLVEGASAASVIERAWQVSAPAINRGQRLPEGVVCCLRQDRYFLSGPPGAGRQFMATVEAAAQEDDGLLTVTGVTHGRAELWLLGNEARELLSRLCGLDLHPQIFPDLTARETSVAKTKQLLIRADLGGQPAYALVGARSLGAYLWQTVVAAGHDMDLQLRGEAWLRRLAATREGHEGG
jgi:sarcosine oxidase subunit alpha